MTFDISSSIIIIIVIIIIIIIITVITAPLLPGGDGEPKQRRGHVYKLAARFGATMAPAARSLKKSLSAGQASRQTQVCMISSDLQISVGVTVGDTQCGV